MIASHARARGEIVVIRSKRARIAIRADVLAWIETEDSRVAEIADAYAAIFRTMRLRRIFQHEQVVAFSYLQNRVHLRRLAIQMYRNDGARVRRDSLLDFVW